MSPNSNIGTLWLKSLRKELTDEEATEFERTLDEHPAQREFFTMNSKEEDLCEDLRILLELDATRIEYKMMVYLKQRRTKRRIVRSVAASLIVLVTAIAYIAYLVKKTRTNSPVVSAIRAHGDIAPGGERATLTLGNGSVIALNSRSGVLTYEHRAPQTHIEYNTVRTPRSGEYAFSLSDGTKVWLNASSWIRFPTQFTGSERIVELTGEAYVEVAKNPSKPFRVIANGVEIDVLGTQLNVAAYAGETFKATLLEGSVDVRSGEQAVQLAPGQQAAFDGKLSVISGVDVDQQIAWKNGMFEFHGDRIETVMNSLSRWYDVDIRYEGKITDRRLTASIKKSTYISDVIQILENSGYRFGVQGRVITVLSD